MIKINDVYYDLNLIDILQELKNQLEINGIYLFSRIKELPEDIMVSCPFHKGGQEKKPSCGLRKDDGWCHCFSCGESCSLEELISRCFGVNDIGQFGINWLKNNFLGDILEYRDFSLDLTREEAKKKLVNAVSGESLDLYRYYHPYMFERKLTEEVINLFDIGYDKETDCITFPIRDIYGKCLFVARRSVTGKYFNYPRKC